MKLARNVNLKTWDYCLILSAVLKPFNFSADSETGILTTTVNLSTVNFVHIQHDFIKHTEYTKSALDVISRNIFFLTKCPEWHGVTHKDDCVSRRPMNAPSFETFIQHAPTWSKQVLSREKWVTASCCEMPHVYPRPDPTPARWAELCNNYVMEPLDQWAATHGERKHRCTWLGWWVHVRKDNCSAAEAFDLGNNNSPLVLLTHLTLTHQYTFDFLTFWKSFFKIVKTQGAVGYKLIFSWSCSIHETYFH